ncbi:hypothetical protein AB1I98_23255 [Enterococcus avium]
MGNHGKKAYVNGAIIAVNIIYFLFLEITGGIKWGKKGYSYRKKVNQEAVRNE